ncbi:MAG: VWA domain-containing protein [Acidobacteria bacterium]|nr:VWA domain-containing protein [Acidobacteriota bacterium]
MTFENLEWLYFVVPVLLLMAILRFWRRHFWGHSLVELLGEEIGGPNPLLRLPKLLEAMAVGFLLVALLGPVYPFSLNRIERGGLQILFVLDLSQSMEEAIAGAAPQATTRIVAAPPRPDQMSLPTGSLLATPGSKMEAVKRTALDFVTKRQGDAIGLIVFSNNGYLVTPATFDHESMSQYLIMTGTHTLVNEGFTAIGEGLGTANRFFEQQKQKSRRRAKGQVIVLFTDGDNNYGRDPMTEIERAKSEGTRIYMIGVALQPGASQQIAGTVPQTGGKYYDVRNPRSLEDALGDINNIEKGIFFTIELKKNEPAYFFFVMLALACLAARLILQAIPQFVEIS